jgi:tagaturonate reductase
MDARVGAEGVAFPAAALRALPERAVQFGTGAFLRGFVDAFIDDANQRGAFMGRVVAIGSTSSGRDLAFAEQDGLYTLIVAGVEHGATVYQRRIIGSVSRAISASAQWADVLTCARDANISVVFSNTTEAGIALDVRDAGKEMMSASDAPHSYPAKLTRFLYERAMNFEFDIARGVVVIPCELLEANGNRLEALVREQAALWSLDVRFGPWLTAAVPFCNTLVDRIVPGTPHAAEHQRLEKELGYSDSLLTMAEPYALFAIEGDDALARRLGFVDDAGRILVVPDVSPYRERKVRLLNGSHTAMAALGILAGVTTVYEAMHLPALAPVLQQLVRQDILSVVDAPDAAAFAEAVLDRFANPQVQHRLTDIATQGTLKWKVRLLPVLQRHAARRTARGVPVLPTAIVHALAAQLYLAHPMERARRVELGLPRFGDDAGDLVLAHWVRSGAARFGVLVDAVLADTSLWDADLCEIEGLATALTESLQRLHHDGVLALLSSSLVTS